MDFSKLRTGEKVAAVSAILLFIDMFLSWYGVDVGPISNALLDKAGVDTTATAWQAFDILDLFLLITILAALGLSFLTATGRSVAMPVAASVITTVLGGLATLGVLYRILNQPGENDVVQVKFGAWLGLLLCAGIVVGGYLAMRDEGTTSDQAVGGSRDSIPVRPAPPAEAPPADGTSVPPPSAPPPPPPSTQPGEEPPPPTPA